MRMTVRQLNPWDGRFGPRSHAGRRHERDRDLGIFSDGYLGAPEAYPASASAPLLIPVSSTPISLTLSIGPPRGNDEISQGRADGAGPKIITIGPPRSAHLSKMPRIIYGTQSGGAP